MATKKPTKKTSTRALTGNRIMHKEIPHTTWTNPDSPTNGWEVVAGGGIIYYETYFDLSGYELDDLTVVPTTLMLQDGMRYNGLNTSNMSVFDIVSQEKLNPADFLLYTLTGNYPGSPGSTEDWEQILMCNYRLMTLQTQYTDATLLLPATGGAFGSSSPTAAQKLWIYRILVPSGDGSGNPVQLEIPATRFVMSASIVKEKELPYMMRLKRSYELATQG